MPRWMTIRPSTAKTENPRIDQELMAKVVTREHSIFHRTFHYQLLALLLIIHLEMEEEIICNRMLRPGRHFPRETNDEPAIRSHSLPGRAVNNQVKERNEGWPRTSESFSEAKSKGKEGKFKTNNSVGNNLHLEDKARETEACFPWS